MKKLYTCLYIFGCPVLWKTQQWRVPLPLSGSVHWVWQKNRPRCHCTVNRNEGKRQRKSDSSWMSNKKEEMYSGREKKKKTGAQRNKEGEKEREKLKVEVEKAKKKKKKRQNINGSLLCLPQSEPKMSQRLTQTPDPIRKVKVRITLSFSCTSMFPAFFNGSVCWLDLPSGADKLTV